MYTLFFCVPALLYQLYSFFMPSCYQEERKNVNILLFFSVLLLFLSIYGSFAILLPKICDFLQQFQYESKCMEIKLQARIGPAVGWSCNAFLFTALFFQMPVLLALAIHWQLIDCDFLKKKRRYVLFSLLLISSLLSPPDLSSQCTLAALIGLFYELFLWSALFHQRWKAGRALPKAMQPLARPPGAGQSPALPCTLRHGKVGSTAALVSGNVSETSGDWKATTVTQQR